MVVRAVCRGTKRDGTPCTARTRPGEQWCYHHDPALAERRSRNASRAATLGNSRVGAEIRSMRLMVRDLVEATISGELDPVVRKRLMEVVQLLQVYARLAELEIDAGERPRAGDVALPDGLPERVRGWAEGEEAKAREREELVGELSAAVRAYGRDPTPIREAMLG